LIRCGSNNKKPIAFNSRSIGREEFVIIVASTYKKDQWTRTISGLFVETCCDFKIIFESHVTKINGKRGKKTS
jgi:hypothetical protein